jgi:phosphate uptake regulator
MRRKIVTQGKTALTISLPIKWARERNLQAGDEIDLIENHGNLTMSSRFKPTSSHITINAKDLSNKSLRLTLVAIYRVGYDKITIHNPNRALNVIHKIVDSHLLGFEVTEISEKIIVIESVTEPGSEKFDILIKKIFYLMNQSLKTICNDLRNNKYRSKKIIENYTKKVDQYANFNMRSISKKAFTTDYEGFYWSFNHNAMIMQHGINFVYEHLSIKKSKIHLKIFEKLQQKFDNTVKGFLTKSPNILQHQIDSIQTVLKQDIINNYKNISPPVFYELSHLVKFNSLICAKLLSIILSESVVDKH